MSSLPIINTPITKLQGKAATLASSICGELEMDYLRCASRVGARRALVDCHKEFDDFKECVFSRKQVKRTDLMEAERRRQKRTAITPLAKDVPYPVY